MSCTWLAPRRGEILLVPASSHLQARSKVQAELAPGSVVIDYTGALAGALTRVAKVAVPVSWNKGQVLHVYIKPGAPGPANGLA